MAMHILKTAAEARSVIKALRGTGSTIALVPTMGALHEGPLSLVEIARRKAERAVVSIFVNPAQFGPDEDFSRYPRTLEADRALLQRYRVDALFAPAPEEIYPQGYQTSIAVLGLAKGLDGAFRPGHFDGVATVVAKLFNIVQPDVAVFGEKDYQQLQIIRRLAKDLNFPVEIVGAPIVREADGLALSSRNRYLSAQERVVAPTLHETLLAAAAAIHRGKAIADALEEGKKALRSAGFGAIDYLELVDAESLAPLANAQGNMRLLAAAKLGTTRLIDNIAVQL